MDILKKIQKMKQSDARNTVMTLLNDRTIYGDSPLHCALRYGQKAVIKRILMLMSTLNSDAQDLTNISNGSGKVSFVEKLERISFHDCNNEFCVLSCL